MTDFDGKKLLAEIRANNAKLNGCACHRFDPPVELKLNLKLTCLSCGGEMRFGDIGQYIKGYEAAGKSADDIWPGWGEDGRHK